MLMYLLIGNVLLYFEFKLFIRSILIFLVDSIYDDYNFRQYFFFKFVLALALYFHANSFLNFYYIYFYRIRKD